MSQILVVEDDRDMLTLYRLVLSKKGRTIRAVQDGASALETLKESDYTPDVVFLDINLKAGISGFGVIEHMRQEPETQKIPIVVITANDLHRDYALKRGIEYFLVKPVDIDTLEDIADRLCVTGLICEAPKDQAAKV
jgi:CheY-like chemotaxis protein